MFEDSWANYITAFTAFFVSHIVFARPPSRPLLIRALTQAGFSIIYSLISFMILWWLIAASRTAPYVELWRWSPWQNWIPIAVMLPVCLIASFGIAIPNPFSFGGIHNNRFDPGKPGIIRWMRHPVLAALFLWSVAHIVPNGSLAHLILFSAFAVFSLIGMKLIDQRRQKEMGINWIQLQTAMKTSACKRQIPIDGFYLRLLLGILLYAALTILHPFFTGINLLGL